LVKFVINNVNISQQFVNKFVKINIVDIVNVIVVVLNVLKDLMFVINGVLKKNIKNVSLFQFLQNIEIIVGNCFGILKKKVVTKCFSHINPGKIIKHCLLGKKEKCHQKCWATKRCFTVFKKKRLWTL